MNQLNRHIVWYLILGSLIIGFFLFILYPDYRSTAQKEEEIQSLRWKIEEQALLFPLHEALNNEIEQLERIEFSAKTDEKSGMECDPYQSVTDIRALIEKHPFEVVSIHSSVDIVQDNLKQVTLNMELQGKFLDFQDLLFELAQLTCVKAIERVGIHSSYPNEDIQLKVQLMQAP